MLIVSPHSTIKRTRPGAFRSTCEPSDLTPEAARFASKRTRGAMRTAPVPRTSLQGDPVSPPRRCGPRPAISWTMRELRGHDHLPRLASLPLERWPVVCPRRGRESLRARGPRHRVSTAAPRYAVAIIRTHHATFREWQAPIMVTLRARRGTIDVVGIERPSGPVTVRK